MVKNVLVIAGSSQILLESIKLLLNKGFNIYLTSRKPMEFSHPNLNKYILDVCDVSLFEKLFDELRRVKFDSIIYAAGCVVASPVEFLDETELKKQLDVNLFGLLRVIKFFANNLAKNAKIINISSMASYGLFPFISPYCLSKAASDILLRSFSLESNVRYVSVRPGAVKTKFWTESIRNNENNFLNFAEKYSKEGDFILNNAYKNSQNASNPLIVAKAVCSAVCDKNPPPVINVGSDACLCSWASRLFSASLLDNVIRLAMRLKVK